MKFYGIELTKQGLEQALKNLDNEKYPEERFSTRRTGNKYYCGNDYGVKRLIECFFLDNGKTLKCFEFANSSQLRKLVNACGIDVKLKGVNI